MKIVYRPQAQVEHTSQLIFEDVGIWCGLDLSGHVGNFFLIQLSNTPMQVCDRTEDETYTR